MKTNNANIKESNGFRIFPSARSLRQNGLATLHIEGKLKGISRNNSSFSQLILGGGGNRLDDIDSFVERSVSRIEEIRSSRFEMGAIRSKISMTEISCEHKISRTWEDAIVDCRVELEATERIFKPSSVCARSNTLGTHSGIDLSNIIIYETNIREHEEATYLPSSTGIQSSNKLLQRAEFFLHDISPAPGFGKIPNEIYGKPQLSYRSTDQWRTQTIVQLSDKAIAYEFTHNSRLPAKSEGVGRYIEDFNDNEEFRGIINYPAKQTVLSKAEWNPRDIKMCSPFKACRGESSKPAKSGGVVYSDSSHYDAGKVPDTCDESLEGVYLVNVQVSSEDIESFEHLYKAEFDLLEERNEHVDSQEMAEWRHQAGLTPEQMKQNRIIFNRCLKIDARFFGKRLFPYTGQLDSMASKILRVLDVENNDLEIEVNDAEMDQDDLIELPSTSEKDYPAVTDAPEVVEHVVIDTPESTENTLLPVEDVESDKKEERSMRSLSNAYQLYHKPAELGYEKAVSIGMRDALSDFHMLHTKDDGSLLESHTIRDPIFGEDSAEFYMGKQEAVRVFLLKTKLRFPYMELHELGLPTI